MRAARGCSERLQREGAARGCIWLPTGRSGCVCGSKGDEAGREESGASGSIEVLFRPPGPHCSRPGCLSMGSSTAMRVCIYVGAMQHCLVLPGVTLVKKVRHSPPLHLCLGWCSTGVTLVAAGSSHYRTSAGNEAGAASIGYHSRARLPFTCPSPATYAKSPRLQTLTERFADCVMHPDRVDSWFESHTYG